MVSLQTPGAGRRGAVDSVITDGDGRYFFDRVSKGAYALVATKAGWLDGAFGRRRPEGESSSIEIADGERRPNVELLLWKRSTLAGTLSDEAGEPVVDVLVWAVRRRIISGRPQMELTSAVRTDDHGAFRLGGLLPGDYSVFMPAMISSGPITFSGGSAPMEWYQTMTSIGAAPMSMDRDTGVAAGDGRNVLTGMSDLTTTPEGDAPWMALPPTFLGSGSSTAATFLHLDPGQDRQGVSITARRVPTQRVSGTLVVPGGGTAASHALHLLPASLADFPVFDVATAITDAAGVFTFYGVPAGSYVVRIVKMPAPKGANVRASTAYVDVNRKFVSLSIGGGPGGVPPPVDTEPLLFASEIVSVGDTPVHGLAITLRPGVRISGRAQFDGSAAQPAPEAWPRMSVTVESANGFVPYMRFQGGRFSDDGTFTTPSLLPGAYVLHPSAPAGWEVKSVIADGRDVTERAFDVSSDISDVIVTYTDHAGAIRGSVVSSQGAPDAGATVLLFPAEPDAWVNYGVVSRRLTSTRTSATGTFMFTPPPPGQYLVVAIPDEQSADWRDPAVLARLAATAQRVIVRDGESATLALTTRSIR